MMTAIHMQEDQTTTPFNDRYPYAGGSDHYALYLEDPDGIKIELVGEGV